MSISKLPDPLIAQIADYLHYSDICQLMETNIKNFDIIKGYKKDKIKLNTLHFKHPTMNAYDEPNKHGYLFKNWEQVEENVDKVKQVLDKCSSIDKLEFQYTAFKNQLCNVLMNIKVKIGILHLWDNDFTMEEKLKLGRNQSVVFYFIDAWPSLLNDDFLTQILPRSTIRRWYVSMPIDDPMDITHSTLYALIGGNNVQKTFSIESVHNYITIKALVEVIQILNERNEPGTLNWNLGILQPDQYADAELYFGEHGKMKGIYDVLRDEWDGDVVYKFLTQILPRSTIRRWLVPRPIDDPMNITDSTLYALIGGNNVQKTFSIKSVNNYITIKALVEVIQILHERNEPGTLVWNLGILQPDQYADAELYFGKNGELSGIYEILRDEWDGYVVYKVSMMESRYTINFEIMLAT